MMKAAVLLLLAVLPSCSLGESLDNQCGHTVYVSSGSNYNYYIGSSSNYYSGCRVQFSSLGSTLPQLTISGSSIDSSDCKVNVKGSGDLISKTGGNLDYSSYFTKTVTANNYLSDLYLHVTGTNCGVYALSFIASTGCDSYQFQCNSGQCVWQSDQCDGYSDCTDGSDEIGCSIWGVGSYVGVSVGVFVFFIIVVSLSTICYRRRYTYVRSPIIVTPNSGFITTSTTSGYSQMASPVAPPPYSAVVSSQSTAVTQSRW